MPEQTISIDSRNPNAMADLLAEFPDINPVYVGKSYPGAGYHRYRVHFASEDEQNEFEQWVARVTGLV